MKIVLNNREVLTVKQAAEELDVTAKSIYDFLNSDKLDSILHDKKRYIYKDSVDKLKEERSNNEHNQSS